MTGIALACRAGIVEPGPTDESSGGMTEMAVQRGCNVGVMLAGRGHPMAGRTVIDDAGVIEHRTGERTGVVTDAAVLVGRDMANRFADREHVIVARAAVVDDAGMIKCRRNKAGGHVTGIAIITGRHMIWWR